MRKKSRLSFCVVVPFLIASGTALAAPASENRGKDVFYQSHQVVDFGDDTLEGKTAKPDGTGIIKTTRPTLMGLIKLRRNFDRELFATPIGK